MMRLDVDFSFCCAHDLPNYDGVCHRLHGHQYKMRISVSGKVDPVTGFVADFEAIKRIVTEEILALVDHRYLNEIEGLSNPTAENMAILFWNKLKEPLPGLYEIRLWETPEYSVSYTGE